MLHGTTPYEGNHSHEHRFGEFTSEIESNLNHFIIYQWCDYHEVTGSYTDHARDETYEEIGYECEASRTTYLEYNWFVEYDTGEVITYDYQPDLFEEICAELEATVAGERVEDVGDVWITVDGTTYHCRLTYKSSEVNL